MWPKYDGLCVYVQRDIKLREICLYGNMYQLLVDLNWTMAVIDKNFVWSVSIALHQSLFLSYLWVIVDAFIICT